MRRWHVWGVGIFFLGAVVAEAGSWKDDFNRLCAQTATAESLSGQELDNLVAECDQVIRTVEKSDTPETKVILFRLKKCRNLFVYLREVKKNQAGSQ